MSTLPAPAVAALEEARVLAEHADELTALEVAGWRFGRADSGVFVAERTSTRLYAASVEQLLAHAALRSKPKEPSGSELSDLNRYER